MTELNVVSVYITNEDVGYIIHREDLVKQYKKEILRQLELAIKAIKEQQ